MGIFIKCIILFGKVIFIMIIGFQQVQIQQWKSQLNNYQNEKRHNNLSNMGKSSMNNKTIPYQTQKQTQKLSLHKNLSVQISNSYQKSQKANPDPSLAKYLKYKHKHYRPFDIITSEPLSTSLIETQNTYKKQEPIRNLYNIINGQKIKDHLLKGRVIKLPSSFIEKKVDKSRDFNIINLKYNKNDKQKNQIQQRQQNQKIQQNLQKNHVFDNIYQRFYNPQLEQKYWKEKKVEQIKIASKNFDHNLQPLKQLKQKYKQQIKMELQKQRQKRNDDLFKQLNNKYYQNQSMIERSRQKDRHQDIITQKITHQKVLNTPNSNLNEKRINIEIKRGGFKMD